MRATRWQIPELQGKPVAGLAIPADQRCLCRLRLAFDALLRGVECISEDAVLGSLLDLREVLFAFRGTCQGLIP